MQEIELVGKASVNTISPNSAALIQDELKCGLPLPLHRSWQKDAYFLAILKSNMINFPEFH